MSQDLCILVLLAKCQKLEGDIAKLVAEIAELRALVFNEKTEQIAKTAEATDLPNPLLRRRVQMN
jgi:hypothetical protein